jgi:serine protease Do
MRIARPVIIGIISALAALAQVPGVNPVAPRGSYLGVMVQEIDAARAKALNLNEEAGVDITRVEPGSPADKAGLKRGDVVVQYNGQRVEGMEQFSRFVRETPPGREVKLGIVRDGMPQTLIARLEAHRGPPNFGAGLAPGLGIPGPGFNVPAPDVPGSFFSWRSAVLGIEVESLQGQLAQYFGVKEGVLVRSVMKDSAAEKAGIKAGDVITKIGDSPVATPAGISSRVRSLRGKPVPVTLTRDHKEMTVTVTAGALGEDDQA